MEQDAYTSDYYLYSPNYFIHRRRGLQKENLPVYFGLKETDFKIYTCSGMRTEGMNDEKNSVLTHNLEGIHDSEAGSQN